jgi:carbohydrate kinase (thermoresistant glucokinase family)
MFKGAAVVMGVASCGKTAVGEALATRLGVPFIEGDKLHPAANIAKMSAGIALADEDRWPWLAEIGQQLAGSEGKIASCSALKRVYRERIARAAGRPVAFVFLHGGRALLEKRIAARKGHFMPPSLLDNQLQTLEPPQPDEWALRLDIAQPVAELVTQAASWLNAA